MLVSSGWGGALARAPLDSQPQRLEPMNIESGSTTNLPPNVDLSSYDAGKRITPK